jgi:putative DNA primase/helicase
VVQDAVNPMEGIPHEMRGFPQWVCSGRNKEPVNPKSGQHAKTNDPATWTSYDEAVEATQRYDLCGVGFVLTKEDPFFVVDLDGCIDPETGELSRWADELLEQFSGTYIERSRSDTGLHIVARGRPSRDRTRLWRENSQGIEVYANGQYVELTGKRLCGEHVLPRQEALDWLYSEYFSAEYPEDVSKPAGVAEGVPLTLSDRELLSKMQNTGDYTHFIELYRSGDWSRYSSRSEADLRLCGMLAFWTQRDAERMDRFFRKSGLITPKWDEHHFADGSTYGQHTIQLAVQNCRQVYDPTQEFEASEEVRSKLDRCMEELLLDPWRGRSGPTDRNVLKALIQVAREHGKVHRDGVVVSRSVRDLALDAGCGSTKTVSRAIIRLRRKGKIRMVREGSSRRANTYLIIISSNVPHSLHRRVVNYGVHSSTRARRPYTPSSEGYSKAGRRLAGAEAVTGIGPRRAQILDYVHSIPNPVTLVEISSYLEQSKSYVKSQHLKRLLDEGLLVEVEEEVYDTPPQVEERFERHLEDSGCAAREQRQREAVERERFAWRLKQSEKAGTGSEPPDYGEDWTSYLESPV